MGKITKALPKKTVARVYKPMSRGTKNMPFRINIKIKYTNTGKGEKQFNEAINKNTQT